MKKILDLARKYYDVLSYLFFGVLTTALNCVIYLLCCNRVGLSASVSNVIAWVAAVIFAFITNKLFVFRSRDYSWCTVKQELTRFVGCRIGSGMLETAIIFLTVDVLAFNGVIIKLITSALAMVLNYVGSKILVFREKKIANDAFEC